MLFIFSEISSFTFIAMELFCLHDTPKIVRQSGTQYEAYLQKNVHICNCCIQVQGFEL